MPIGKARLKITEYNEQRKRRLTGGEGRIRMVSLSLTSMVDMFAILVIFLLTSSGTVSEWLGMGHDIQLPKAKYTDSPRKASTLQISQDTLFAEGNPIGKITDITTQAGAIPTLSQWLKDHRSPQDFINIVGDERVQYGVIQKIVATCRSAGFGKVNLAIQPIP